MQITYSDQIYKPLWYKPSHILFLVKKGRSAGANYWRVSLSNWQKQLTEAFYRKSCWKKCSNIRKKIPVLKPLLNKAAGRKAWKKDSSTDVFLWILRNFYLFWRTSLYDRFWSDFKKWLFRTFFRDGCFQNHPDLVILQKYQSLSSQSFKHNSAHIPSINLTTTLSVEPIAGFACS